MQAACEEWLGAKSAKWRRIKDERRKQRETNSRHWGVGPRGWTVVRCSAQGDRPTTALRPHHGAKGSAVKLLDSKPCSRRTSDPHLKLSLSIRMERVLTIPQIARTKWDQNAWKNDWIWKYCVTALISISIGYKRLSKETLVSGCSTYVDNGTIYWHAIGKNVAFREKKSWLILNVSNDSFVFGFIWRCLTFSP